ncbi:hypothetical protein B0H14DRAFT_2589663 [Mycena olivaceomarginata]|nr:hypothetical protein B0H14DRAFT_2589663 [Mycena olivaceomarginata]
MPSSPESYLIYDLEVAWSLAAVSAYFVMFAFYLHLLRTRRLAKHRFLNIATIALFILCTIHCALVLAATILGTRLEMGAVFGSERSFTNVTLAAEAVYITTKLTKRVHPSVIADGIFVRLYKSPQCLAMPDRSPDISLLCNLEFRFKVVILPIFLTLAVAGRVRFGYFTVIDSSLPDNLLIVGVFPVGRIWSLARAARRVMGEKVATKYRTKPSNHRLNTCNILVLSVEFEADNYALTDLGDHGRDRIGTGIAPTIIAVRVGLGYSVESVDSFIAPTPRTRAVSQFPAARHVESADEILYIRPLSEKVETEDKNCILGVKQSVRNRRPRAGHPIIEENVLGLARLVVWPSMAGIEVAVLQSSQTAIQAIFSPPP